MSEIVDERLMKVNAYKTEFTLTCDMSEDWICFTFQNNMSWAY